MSENSGRYSYFLLITLITFMVILLGFIREIFKCQTRQIRYTRNQLCKIGKTFYLTRVNENTANTITSLGIRQTFRTRKVFMLGWEVLCKTDCTMFQLPRRISNKSVLCTMCMSTALTWLFIFRLPYLMA